MAVRATSGIARRRLTRGPSVAAGDVVLTPVVLDERSTGVGDHGGWLVAAKRPVAVIVSGPEGRRLMRLDETEDV